MDDLEKKGFVLIKDFFSIEEAKIITDTGDKLFNLPEKKGGYMKYYENTENGRILSRMEYFINVYPELKCLLKSKIKPKLEELLKEKVTLLKDKINWKLPGGGKFKPHQDHGAYNDFPPEYYVTAAVSLDISTVENGCLEMVSGKHTEGILKNENGDIVENLVSSMEWKPVLSTPRDLLLFDSFVPHRSDINKTKNPRRIFYFTFNKEKEGDHYEEYFSKKRKQFPPDCEREKGVNYNLNCKYNLANPMN